MHDLALEGLDPGDLWRARFGEAAVSGYQDVCGPLPLRGFEAPSPPFVVPLRALNLVLETDVLHDPVALGATAQVLPDLGLRRVRAAPIRVHGERERVQVGGHIALASRVRVVAPGS